MGNVVLRCLVRVLHRFAVMNIQLLLMLLLDMLRNRHLLFLEILGILNLEYGQAQQRKEPSGIEAQNHGRLDNVRHLARVHPKSDSLTNGTPAAEGTGVVGGVARVVGEAAEEEEADVLPEGREDPCHDEEDEGGGEAGVVPVDGVRRVGAVVAFGDDGLPDLWACGQRDLVLFLIR